MNSRSLLWVPVVCWGAVALLTSCSADPTTRLYRIPQGNDSADAATQSGDTQSSPDDDPYGEGCDHIDDQCWPPEEDCINSEECSTQALCGQLKNGNCVVNDYGCHYWPGCIDDELCGFEDGECVVNAEGCAWLCKSIENGRCGYADGHCVTTAEGCAAPSLTCTEYGMCGFEEGRTECVLPPNKGFCTECVATAKGCAASHACEQRGLCGFEEGNPICVVTPKGCAESKGCAASGLCGFEEGNPQCLPTAEGCAESGVCAQSGSCGFEQGNPSCVVTAEGCADSEDCADDGQCGVEEGYPKCVVTAEGCANSRVCLREGECLPEPPWGQEGREWGNICSEFGAPPGTGG
jgi:hypothetical protein